MYCQNRLTDIIWVVLVVCLLAGCGDSDLPSPIASSEPAVENTIPTADVETAVTEVESENQIAEEKLAKGKGEIEQQSEPVQEAVEYAPPYPDRVELFKAPKREGRGIAATLEGSEQAVELLGFVNVASPQVVLSVDGIVTPLEEGSKISEIEVISIQPPAVVLQRGRQRWRAALEN